MTAQIPDPAAAAPAPIQPTSPAPTEELAELRARLAQLEQQENANRQDDGEQRRQEAAQALEDWPRKGYDGPAPWEAARLHAADGHTRAVSPDPYRGPGEVTHSEPLLTEGAAGEPVARLAELLRVLGYRDNTIARGENPAFVLDQSVMHDVVAFARAHNVAEDLESFRGGSVPAEDAIARIVGPYTWQALHTAARRRAAEAVGA
jgi:hypothetical protein